jgi:hypothetical protein
MAGDCEQMSAAERFQRAKARQGKLTLEQWAELEEDILRLLNGKRSPKTLAQIEGELIQFCGWDRHKIKGPRSFTTEILYSLRWHQKLVRSKYYPEISGDEIYWREAWDY